MEGVYSFRVQVQGDIYELQWDYPNHNQHMLVNSSMEVPIEVIHRYTGENGNEEELVQGYRLEINRDENGDLCYDTDLVHVEVMQDEQGSWLEITSNDRDGGTGILLSAFGEDENGEEYEMCSAWIYLNVDYVYWSILPADLGIDERVNPEIGETLDMNAFGPAVYRYEENQEPVPDEEARIRMEYDDNAWSVVQNGTDAENKQLPVLKRIGDWGTVIVLIAEKNFAEERQEEDWQEIARQEYRLDGLDYGVFFEELRNGEEYYTWLYTTEDFRLGLNTENLPEGFEAHWTLGLYDEAEDMVKPFRGAAELYDVAADGSFITLHGAALEAMEQGSMNEDRWFDVNVDISIDGIRVSGEQIGVQLRDEVYEYDGCWDEILLPNQDLGIHNRIGVYYENAAEPWGAYEEQAVTNVEITEQKAWSEEGGIDAEDIISVEGNAQDGWNVHANNYGYAVLTVAYEPIPGDPNPGEGLDLTAEAWHQCYEEERGEYPGETNVEVVWEKDGEGFDENLVMEQDIENPAICRITATENAENGWNGRILVQAYLLNEAGNREKDEEGNDIVVADNEFWICICMSYCSITPISLENEVLAVGEEITITPQLWDNYRNDNGDNIRNEVTEGIRKKESGLQGDSARNHRGEILSQPEEGKKYCTKS